LLLAGLPARWAALPLLLPFGVVPAYWVLPDHPDALAAFALVSGAMTVLVVVVSSIVAFWYAGRASARQRTRGALLGLVALFVLASFAGQAALMGLRQTRLEPFRIPSPGMLPTLIPGDQLFVDKRRLSRSSPGDVVVFRPPGDHPEPHVKRVIGVEGDTVETRGHQVWVNGQELTHVPVPSGQPCSVETSDTVRGRCIHETLRPGTTYQLLLIDRVSERRFGPRTLASGELFVLGDNRDNSYDSRQFGPIREDRVLGKALVVWWSWWDWRPRLSRVGLKP
jgi:signal peptidase I